MPERASQESEGSVQEGSQPEASGSVTTDSSATQVVRCGLAALRLDACLSLLLQEEKV